MILFLVLVGCGPQENPKKNKLVLNHFYNDYRYDLPLESAFTLSEKATQFQRLLENEFITQEGLICVAKPVDEKGPQYGNFSKQAELTALALVAEIHRYRITKNMDAIYNLNQLMAGLNKLFEVTQIPGYPASALAPSQETSIRWQWNSASGKTDPRNPLTKYHWLGDTSKQTYSAILLALMEIYQHVENFPKLRQRAIELIVSMADYVHESQQAIVGEAGQITQGGDLYTHVLVIPGLFDYSIGVNSLNALALQVAAFEVSGQPRFKIRFLDLIYQGALKYLDPHQFEPWSFGHSKAQLASFYAGRILLSCRYFSENYKQPVRDSLTNAWQNNQDPYNVFQAALVAKWLDYDFGPLEDYLLQYADSRLRSELDLRKSFSRKIFPNKNNKIVAREALPLNVRGISELIWDQDPFVLQRHVGQNGKVIYAPVDYLVAYWLARSEGFVSSS